ncbi:glycerol kinase [Harmonia axyridis]|uniref:glycerol kinase n=1 Tax=Harmonia axyridis TaxID=115357 RepID=UPI001E2757F5|nr:glycerol kinase [Harmonia axyridis]
MSDNKRLIGAISAGTQSVKFSVFRSQETRVIAEHEVRISSYSPQEGWMEQDPIEIICAVRTCLEKVSEQLGSQTKRIVTIGITNQRETTILWDKISGSPFYNAIVWNDIRTDSTVDIILSKVPEGNPHHFKQVCGLPISPYFSAFKVKWLLHYSKDIKQAVRQGRCLFGTVDTWIVWNLTGGTNDGIHVTDVTNASRTFLMNINTLNWDSSLLHMFKINDSMLPEIKSSAEVYGCIHHSFPLRGVPISGIVGNQQAALIGHNCLQEGQAKNTYRSGCFLLYNTGQSKVFSTHGLVTTVAYKFGKQPAVYALEGSVAVAGAAIKWLKNNMGFIQSVQETETLAKEVFNTGDVYFVPAFKGLYAPYWRKEARGIICGLTAFSTKHHIVRAALEAVCFQTRDILEAMHKDCGIPLNKLMADGKLTQNTLLMQLQADIGGTPVFRSQKEDMAPLGAAIAASQAEGIDAWDLNQEGREIVPSDTFLPTTTEDERDARYTKWKMAVQRSLGWATTKRKTMTEERYRLLASIPGGLFLIGSFALLLLSEITSKPQA